MLIDDVSRSFNANVVPLVLFGMPLAAVVVVLDKGAFVPTALDVTSDEAEPPVPLPLALAPALAGKQERSRTPIR